MPKLNQNKQTAESWEILPKRVTAFPDSNLFVSLFFSILFLSADSTPIDIIIIILFSPPLNLRPFVRFKSSTC